jgi:hypothetical protein
MRKGGIRRTCYAECCTVSRCPVFGEISAAADQARVAEYGLVLESWWTNSGQRRHRYGPEPVASLAVPRVDAAGQFADSGGEVASERRFLRMPLGATRIAP